MNKPLPKGLIGIPEEKHAEISRRAMERSLEIIEEMKKRKRKKLHAKSFYEFVKWHWPTLEPETKLIDGWALQAICEHLQATAEGTIRRIHINVPPGFMKSLLTNVFFPAWCWGPFNRPHWRFLSFSYAASLTARDNRKLSAVLNSYPYQLDWGDTFEILKDGESLITNSITGWKLASSIGGVSTGERADFVLCLPASERILTDNGWLPIGEIVEQRLDVKIAGYDEQTTKINFQTIDAYERNPGNDLIEIRWTDGSVRCTPEHPIFVPTRGYVAASEVRPGDSLVWSGVPFHLPELQNRNQAQAVLSENVLFEAVQGRASTQSGNRTQFVSVFRLLEEILSTTRACGAICKTLLLKRMSGQRIRSSTEPHVERGIENDPVPLVRQAVSRKGRQVSRVLFVQMQRTFYTVSQFISRSFQALCSMLKAVCSELFRHEILFGSVQKRCAFQAHGGNGQQQLGSWRAITQIPEGLEQKPQGHDSRARQPLLPVVREDGQKTQSAGRSSHRLQQGQYRSDESDYVVQKGSQSNARQYGKSCDVQTRIVQSVAMAGKAEVTYNVRVTPHHNYFAEGILLHNCDDPHNVKEAESKTIRTNTTTWFREAMQNRLNSIKNSRVIVIMQRVNEEDVSGVILNNDMDYEHLMIPMEYDPNRHCETKIGWEDPRTEEGELAWPERFDEEDCAKLKNDIGEYAWAGQYQQTPEVRGGGIFKREWWQLWEERTYPTFDYIVAYLDPAYTEKEENDPSAMTIWGVFKKNGLPKIMLIYAWEKREELHGLVNETFKAAKKWQSDILLIENKASGISVSQEIRRLYVGAPFAVRLDEPEGDKVARAHAASHVWEQGMVYVPTIDGEVVDWAQKVIDHMAVFPKGSHDDITDTATGAVRFLRRMGLLERSDELQEQASSEMAYQSGKYVTKPLYPC